MNVQVDLGANSYEIFIGADILGNVGNFVAKNFTKALLVTQQKIFDLHGRTLIDGLDAAKVSYTVATIPDGETSKTCARRTNFTHGRLSLASTENPS